MTTSSTFSSGIDARIVRSLADASPVPYWLDRREAPPVTAALVQDISCDLLVVGAGFTGLWTALLAKERDPSLDVVIVEAEQIGWAATGRNGGFVSASLTHGLRNGVERFASEMPTLIRLGEENFSAIAEAIERHGIAAEWEQNGEISVATNQWQVQDLEEYVQLADHHGVEAELWDANQIQATVASPTYLGAVHERTGTAIVDPAKLAWGLALACQRAGVRIFERTKVSDLSEHSGAVVATSGYGSVRAPKVALATNIFPNLVRRARAYVVPVWDYVLMTEPLTVEQMASIGWADRQGIGDSGNQFHYYRLTDDNRILWGGYDAIYRFGNGLDRDLEQRPATFAKLASHFFTTFPQLEGVRFTHTWGGAIDTSTRFCAFWGQAYRGRVAYVLGYTGLGVGATRFGAQVMLDMLDGRRTELTELQLVRSKPLPFPPEPFRYGGIQLTRWSLDRADHNGGRRNIWLRSLDRLGLGFDS